MRPGPDLLRWAGFSVRLNFAGSFETCPSEDVCSCISSCVWPFGHSSHHTSITVYNTPVSPLAKRALLCLIGLRITCRLVGGSEVPRHGKTKSLGIAQCSWNSRSGPHDDSVPVTAASMNQAFHACPQLLSFFVLENMGRKLIESTRRSWRDVHRVLMDNSPLEQPHRPLAHHFGNVRLFPNFGVAAMTPPLEVAAMLMCFASSAAACSRNKSS